MRSIPQPMSWWFSPTPRPFCGVTGNSHRHSCSGVSLLETCPPASTITRHKSQLTLTPERQRTPTVCGCSPCDDTTQGFVITSGLGIRSIGLFSLIPDGKLKAGIVNRPTQRFPFSRALETLHFGSYHGLFYLCIITNYRTTAELS